MPINAVITVKSEGSASDHVNAQILADFTRRVSADLAGNANGVRTEVTIAYIKGEPIEGTPVDGPTDFSAEPEAAEAVKVEAETEDPDRTVRSRNDATNKRRRDKNAAAKAEPEA